MCGCSRFCGYMLAIVVQDYHQNTAVFIKTTQVGDMRLSHTICKPVASSNKLDMKGICAVFILAYESTFKK
jgi:hypothetical protein